MGSPNKANTHEVHGAALGDVEIAAARPHIGWHHLPFEIPEDVYQTWDARAKGQKLEDGWNHKFAEYAA
jgi:transketolase